MAKPEHHIINTFKRTAKDLYPLVIQALSPELKLPVYEDFKNLDELAEKMSEFDYVDGVTVDAVLLRAGQMTKLAMTLWDLIEPKPLESAELLIFRQFHSIEVGQISSLRTENKQLRERLKKAANPDSLINYQQHQINDLINKLHEKNAVIRDAQSRISQLRSEVLELSQAPQNKSRRAGFVYLIEASNGTYKIGRTKDPDDRMKTFNVKLPFAVEYLTVIQTDDMYSLERDLHQRFADKRLDGSEFFQLSTDDIAYIAGLVQETA